MTHLHGLPSVLAVFSLSDPTIFRLDQNAKKQTKKTPISEILMLPLFVVENRIEMQLICARNSSGLSVWIINNSRKLWAFGKRFYFAGKSTERPQLQKAAITTGPFAFCLSPIYSSGLFEILFLPFFLPFLFQPLLKKKKSTANLEIISWATSVEFLTKKIWIWINLLI